MVVAGVIEKEGAFLLARRAPHKADAGYWEFPGGKVENDESPQEALKRELAEELEVDAQIGDLIHQGRHQGLDFEAYFASIGPMEPALKDHDALEWVAAGGFGRFRMHPFDQEVAQLLGKSSR